jgi:nicotinamidase-related amidase
MKALLVIDVQNNLTSRKDFYNLGKFITTINTSIIENRREGNLIVFFQHNNKLLENGTTGWEIDHRLEKASDDLVLQKFNGDSFEGTILGGLLKEKAIKEILVCGLVSSGCIKATCKGGIKRGFKVQLLRNGHSCWGKDAEKIIAKTESELITLGVEITN